MRVEPRTSIVRRAVVAALLCGSVCSLSALAAGKRAEPLDRPNVLWVVWDTVRADHLSVYGYGKPTTPKLAKWAENARVFERCSSTAGQTLPATASMFTGLYPAEHGTNPANSWLDGRFTTIAERFRDAGYRTYLFSANAYISREHNFHRGFDVEEHPWDEPYLPEALRIVREKLNPEKRTARRDRVRSGEPRKGDVKASGALAQRALETWLRESDPGKPFFAFLNYMEAHRPCIPLRPYRERMLSPEQTAASYEFRMEPWDYTFGFVEYPAEKVELIRGVYDAALAELDDLFANLLAGLEASGHLEDTVVVFTSDHGEHLADHNRIGHQFSVYEELIRVPLIVRYGNAFPPGRDTRPVSTLDLFVTLLELARIDVPGAVADKGVSLLSPAEGRVRFAEYPAVHPSVDNAAMHHVDWDSRPWRRKLHAIYAGDLKFIAADDGHRELYRLAADPFESKDLAAAEPGLAAKMSERLRSFVAALSRWEADEPAPEMSPEQRERLEALGYLGHE